LAHAGALKFLKKTFGQIGIAGTSAGSNVGVMYAWENPNEILEFLSLYIFSLRHFTFSRFIDLIRLKISYIFQDSVIGELKDPNTNYGNRYGSPIENI
jgi:predicted acylesterase/phospholipase RssA